MVDKKKSKNDYDVIVIGAGPAGMSASIYTSRAKLKTLLIGKPKEGALYKAHIVANYFGFAKPPTGKKIVEDSMKQTQGFGTFFVEGEVTNSTKEKEVFKIKLENGKIYTGKNIIITTGKSYKILGAKNEEALSGKGVHYCATCDGYYYQNKKIIIVGHSNLAAEEALGMLSYTKDITIFSNGLEFDFSEFLGKQLKKNKITMRKEKIKKEKLTKVKIAKEKPVSELEKLESELSDIEEKLKSLQ